jgi:hypothetical protein
MQRIFALLIVVVAVASGIFWYVHWSQTRALNSGDVYVRDQPGDNAKPVAPEPVPPEPAVAQATASAPAQPVAAPTPQPVTTAKQPPTVAQPAATPKPQPTPPQIASNAAEQANIPPSHIHPSHIASAGIAPVRHPVAIPASDTIRRNPPNGEIFGGSGRFQLYRQGDITWRVDTQTGHACILFATDAQWSQTRVFDYGCGAS